MSIFLKPRSATAVCSRRAFSTCPRLAVSLQLDKNNPETIKDLVPEYPYGANRWYKQSNLGLYGGQKIRFGNNVGEEFGVKSRRKWRPNVRVKKLWSNALQGSVQVRVTTRTLRTIDKLGGLDEYVLGEKEARIRELGETGWWLRWAIMQTPAIKKRFAAEKDAIGLEEVVASVPTTTNIADIVDEAEEVEVEITPEQVFAEKLAEQPSARSRESRVRFRTGRGKHLMLTPDGWRRARPTYKLGLVKKHSQGVNEAVEAQVEKLTSLIEKEDLDAAQQQRIISALKPEIKRKIRVLQTPYYKSQVDEAVKAEEGRRRGVLQARRARYNEKEKRKLASIEQVTAETAEITL